MSTPGSTENMLAEIRVPRETVNDDVVTVQAWHVKHGDSVRPKQVVVSIETSKAVLEVEAEAAGFVEIVHGQGAEVGIGELIGRVLASEPAAKAMAAPARPAVVTGGANGHNAANGAATGNAAGAGRSSNRLRDRREAAGPSADADEGGHVLPERAGGAVVVSKKAQRLVDEHGIDAQAVFAGMGLVREVDVIRHLEEKVAARRQAEPETPSPATEAVEQAAQATAAAANEVPPKLAAATVNSAYSTKPRGLFGDAASSAKDRGNRSILWLGWNYFWRNWLLGNLARWAPRGVILPIHRWRGVKMGKDVFIDPTAIIETAFPENITIGNDVRITAGCVIMSHIKAPHYLRETGLVPVVLKPVVLEDHCFIGVNSVIMPGVTIGKASVVTSGSVVVTNVPAYSMVQGNPAKVIKQFPRPE